LRLIISRYGATAEGWWTRRKVVAEQDSWILQTKSCITLFIICVTHVNFVCHDTVYFCY